MKKPYRVEVDLTVHEIAQMMMLLREEDEEMMANWCSGELKTGEFLRHTLRRFVTTVLHDNPVGDRLTSMVSGLTTKNETVQ